MLKEIAFMHSEAELKMAEDALKIGNKGKARVCARRACSYIISNWLEQHKNLDWGKNAMSLLEGIRAELNFPVDVRNAANRLTAKVDLNFNTGFDESPLEDARTIINYFLNN